MSNGGAQYHSFGPYFNTDGTPCQNIWLIAYVAGAYTTPKNFYTGEDKTGTVTERQGGTDGSVDGYFDGVYNFKIFKSDKTTLIKSIATFKITSDTMDWEGNWGPAYPSASAATKGMIFSVIDGNNDLRSIGINENTAIKDIITFDTNGNQVLNSIIPNGMPVYNVLHSDFGALTDESTDSTDAFQLAVNAIPINKAGVVYVPGRYSFVINGTITITDRTIYLLGDGAGVSRLIRTETPATPRAMFTYTSSNVRDVLGIKGLSFLTKKTGATGDIALNLTFATNTATGEPSNLFIDDVEIGPDEANKTNARWDRGIVTNYAKSPVIKNFYIRGGSDNTVNGAGIETKNYTDTIDLGVGLIKNLGTAVIIGATCSDVYINKVKDKACKYDLDVQVSTNIYISDSELGSTLSSVITSSSAVPHVAAVNSYIHKSSGSSEDWRGFTGDFDSLHVSANCRIHSLISAGTDYGVQLKGASTGRHIIKGNDFFRLDNAVRVEDGVTHFSITGNSHYASTGDGYFVYMVDNNDHFTITDNETDCASLADAAVYVGGTTPSPATGIIANNRFVTGATTAPVQSAVTLDPYIIIEGNTKLPIEDGTIASAASITLPVTGDTFTLSGTTTVKNIVGGRVNRKVTLRGNAFTTVAVDTNTTGVGQIKLGTIGSFSLTGIYDNVELQYDVGSDIWFEKNRVNASA